MQKVNFKLNRPVRLTPLTGETDVEIKTTGDVLVSEYEPRPASLRRVHVASTDRATLTSSPKGLLLTMKIILPTTIASEREFHRQVELLYDAMQHDCV